MLQNPECVSVMPRVLPEDEVTEICFACKPLQCGVGPAQFCSESDYDELLDDQCCRYWFKDWVQRLYCVG